MTLESFLEETRRRIDLRLSAIVPEEGDPIVVALPARYALLSPGKRLRPAVLFAVAELFRGGEEGELLETACAIEMLHASSLVFDDLPSMDGADLRRGRPTTHKQFGEAMAILAGIELLHRAFALLAEQKARSRKYPLEEMIRLLSESIGLGGVVGGQAIDLTVDPRAVDLRTLEAIHSRKTGALFIAAATAGAILAGARPPERAAVHAYAKNLGLAFQITDDLLDATGDSAETGKKTGMDAGKTTFVSFLGEDGARSLAAELTEFAEHSLVPFGKRGALLASLARFVRNRTS